MRRLIAISLAFLILIISMKVSVDFHYCSGKLAQSKIVIGSGKATCGMEESENNCKTNSSSTFSKSSCCKDELKQINTDNFQQVYHFKLSSIEYITLIQQTNELSFFKEFEVVSFHCYRPPPDITAVSLSFTGVFLI